MSWPFWIDFTEGKGACLGAANEGEALALATKLAGRTAVRARLLPYAADPLLNRDAGTSLCFDPEHCAGFSSCPKRYACSE
ncbi:MAG TPA: hypothetical protein VGK73_25185 [Polyangiaceae bacterium]